MLAMVRTILIISVHVLFFMIIFYVGLQSLTWEKSSSIGKNQKGKVQRSHSKCYRSKFIIKCITLQSLCRKDTVFYDCP